MTSGRAEWPKRGGIRLLGAIVTFRERIEAALRRLPVPALRDVVDKQPSAGPNIDVLDGIRGLAVLLVIASHTGAFHLNKHGGVGVWLFFCLSAFLLTMPFAARPERAVSGSALLHYTVRRIRRILPAYYLLLLFEFTVLNGVDLARLVEHALFLRGDNILWTIPQEVLFYVVLPLLAAAHFLIFRSRRAITIVALVALALWANLEMDTSMFKLNGNGRWMRFYLGVFVTGVAFSYAHSSPVLARIVARPAVNRVLGALGLGLLALLVLTAPYFHQAWFGQMPILRDLQSPMGWSYQGTYAVACSALIYIALVCNGRLVHWILSSVALRAFGITSYSLYLWHLIVRDRLLESGVPAGLPLFAATLAIAYPLACTVYAFVERPFLRSRAS
jgi:peptidoglycan/LPS O-acetylase OafA/YrhL